MTRGRGGAMIPLKNIDVIYEKPLQLNNIASARSWSCPGLQPSSQAPNSPFTMFLSAIWSGTQPSAGVTLVNCFSLKICLIHIIIMNFYCFVKPYFTPPPTDHLELAELGTYNLAGILFSMAVPCLSAWIVIITRQVVLCLCFSYLTRWDLNFPSLRQSMCIIPYWCSGKKILRNYY